MRTVSLGGSRAEGTNRPDSDWDFSLYYRGRFDPQTLRDIGWPGAVSAELIKSSVGLGFLLYMGRELNDAAQACSLIDRKYGDQFLKLFDASEHGRALREAGFEADLTACATLDAHPVIPIYQDRQITKLGPDRER